MGSGDENKDRGNWDSKADYLLSCIGYAVGLGNVWRFPYLAYENGGGAFLIPYVIMLVFAGLPIFFMEVALGQFSSLGPIAVWKFNPFLKGVGICMVVLSAFVGIYYNVIIAYTVFYFFSSLTSKLPWTDCNNFWNDAKCATEFQEVCISLNLTGITITNTIRDFLLSNNTISAVPGSLQGLNKTIFDTVYKADVVQLLQLLPNGVSDPNGTLKDIGCETYDAFRGSSASEQYWTKYVLNIGKSMDPAEDGGVNTHLALSLLVAWIVVFYSLVKGIKSSGKVVYFTALFPYAVLLIFVIRGATLEGAMDGVDYFIGSKSNLTKLAEANVWKSAATQIFFSLSAAWGGLIALSSYNKFENNCFADAVIVCTVNCATSIFAGFAIFTVVGHMAFKLQLEVPQVVEGGFGLAFVAYPEAISNLPAPTVWAILFFLMLFTLGLDSQFTILETVVTAMADQWPSVARKRRWALMLGTAIVMFLLALNCCTNAGMYWVNLIDTYAAGWGLLIVAVLEVTAVSYIYGINRFIEDIEMMIGKKHWTFWIYWRACWVVITPLLLAAILIWSLVTFTAPTYGSFTYPDWQTPSVG